jgi:hypothetical protein
VQECHVEIVDEGRAALIGALLSSKAVRVAAYAVIKQSVTRFGFAVEPLPPQPATAIAATPGATDNVRFIAVTSRSVVG